MTILTLQSMIQKQKPSSGGQNLNQDQNADKNPLFLNDLESNSSDYPNDKKSPLIVTMLMRSRAQRLSSMTTVCVFLTALLVFTTGIVGGYYLYRQFTQYKLRHYRAWCSIPYDRAEMMDSSESSFLSFNSLRKYLPNYSPTPQSLTNLNSINNNKLRSQIDSYMDEEFDVDLEYQEFERIEVPDFGLGGKGRFIHDFNVNLTGIIDLNNNRCFVLPLNRTSVIPPRNLVDMLMKVQAGYYNIDTTVIRESYKVVLPEISNYKNIGYYIARECGKLPTYRLEKVHSEVFKRSIQERSESKPIFSEFAGKNIVEFHIDATNVPGKHTGHK